MKYTSRILILSVALGLSACSGFTVPNPFKRAEPAAIAPPVLLETDAPAVDLGGGGQSPDALDTASATDLAVAADVSGGAFIGDTVASLGDPTQPGLWLRTPLVSAETPGRLEADNGTSLAVTLIPIEGSTSAGSRISLSAMRGLGLGLTDLPIVKVFRVTASG